jgi:hypothetical protein
VRSAALLVLALAPLALSVLSLGLQGCASGGPPEKGNSCDRARVSDCEGQCTTYGDPEHYDECMESCSSGCD